MNITGTTLSGGQAKPGETVILKQNDSVIGTGVKQGDGSVSANGTTYKPIGG